MIEIFYKTNGQMEMSQTVAAFADLKPENVIWIDLFAPTGEEKRATEAFVGTTIQSRAQAEEIESSSRFSETDSAIFANTNFLIPGPEEYSMETVSFILTDSAVLVTLRECPLRSFTDLQRRLLAFPKFYPNGYIVFVSILEQRIDLDADMIELMSKEIEQFNRKVSLGEDINEEFLLASGHKPAAGKYHAGKGEYSGQAAGNIQSAEKQQVPAFSPAEDECASEGYILSDQSHELRFRKA